jgi:uncharacterized protein YdeI (YjbR/CyaY-like superfamily)
MFKAGDSQMDTIACKDREEWRNWLEKYHGRSEEIWLVFYKKHTGRPTVTYNQAVEEALCFGWIDSIIKRIDAERYAQKFTPRRKSSKWSRTNIARAKKMMESGRMTDAGMQKFQPVLEGKTKPEEKRPIIKDLPLPPAFEKALNEHPKARDNFESLAESHQRPYLLWISLAKKEETRTRRIKEAIRLLRKGEKLGLK